MLTISNAWGRIDPSKQRDKQAETNRISESGTGLQAATAHIQQKSMSINGNKIETLQHNDKTPQALIECLT